MSDESILLTYDGRGVAAKQRALHRIKVAMLLEAAEIASKEGEGAPDEIYEAACRNVCDAILERSREI